MKRRFLIAGAVLVLLLLGAGALFAASTWGEVNRVTIDRPESDESGGAMAQPEDDEEPNPELDTPTPLDSGLHAFLLVGSDSREELADTKGFGEFEGNRADVVMVLLKDGTRTGLLSLPRDLVVDDPCRGGEERLSEMLEGCEMMNGPTLLTVVVEDVIGKPIEHFALVDFAGFQAAVDAVGGYEICVEHPVRDQRANLQLPAGCTMATGEQTLAWMRSRHTQELTEDGWQTMAGVNDLVRNERQRAFLMDIMGRIGDVTSPQDMAQSAQSVAGHVTVDSELSLVDAVNIAWTMRGLGSDRVTEISVPVYDDTTSGGASVLRPQTPIDEIVAEFLTSAAATNEDEGVVLGLAG